MITEVEGTRISAGFIISSWIRQILWYRIPSALMSVPYLGPQDLRNALPMKDAIDALDNVFSGALPSAPPRSHLDVGRGDLLVMPAWGEELGVGVKLVTVAPANPSSGLPLIHGIYVLFDYEALRPLALLDGAALTGIRTAAVSAVATRYLARKKSKTLLVFGGGTQGQAHIEAMGEVLPELAKSCACPVADFSRTPREEGERARASSRSRLARCGRAGRCDLHLHDRVLGSLRRCSHSIRHSRKRGRCLQARHARARRCNDLTLFGFR